MDVLTAVFNLSATLAWSTTRPTEPLPAFIGSVDNGSLAVSALFGSLLGR